MKLTRDMSLRMRGVAILLICLHNLLHLDSYVMECEFAFMDYRVNRLTRCFSFTSGTSVEFFFSFFGWYGVPLFMFMSGYGLATKYERPGVELQVWPFLKHHFVKLWLLMAPAYLLFLVAEGWMNDYVPDIPTLISQLTLTHNFWDAEGIRPGVYWYFGLSMQFYIWYLLFYYLRSEKVLWAAFAVTLAMGEYFALSAPDSPGHFLLRHNSLLWLPVFLMGIWMSRHADHQLLRWMMRCRWVLAPVVTLLWVYTSVHVSVWVLSPLLAVILLILLCGGSGRSRLFGYVGGISAGVFVCHPILRVFARPLIQQGYDKFWVCLVYTGACLFMAALYLKLTSRRVDK